MLAATLWLIMLLYFAIWYTMQPKAPFPIPPHRPTIPKPCHSFSLWPHVSCIGQHQYRVFRGVCISMALLIAFSFILLAHKSEVIEPGRWLRRIGAYFAVVSCVALIAVSYEGIDEMPLAHLITASGQIFSMFVCNCFHWSANLLVSNSWGRRVGRNRRIRVLEVSRWFKVAIGVFSFGKSNLYILVSVFRRRTRDRIANTDNSGPAIFTCIGIYGCNDPVVVADKASTCNRLVALSEVAEWTLSIGWVAYLCLIAFDIYHIDTVVWIWKNVGVDGASGDEKNVEEEGHVQELLPRDSTYKSSLE
tara:strand:+ start:2951 stop:3865 length:915 start_codon:yes stop_codon:yes gene_type:complete